MSACEKCRYESRVFVVEEGWWAMVLCCAACGKFSEAIGVSSSPPFGRWMDMGLEDLPQALRERVMNSVAEAKAPLPDQV